jgi:hypothetical protein
VPIMLRVITLNVEMPSAIVLTVVAPMFGIGS